MPGVPLNPGPLTVPVPPIERKLGGLHGDKWRGKMEGESSHRPERGDRRGRIENPRSSEGNWGVSGQPSEWPEPSRTRGVTQFFKPAAFASVVVAAPPES